MTGKSGNIKY